MYAIHTDLELSKTHSAFINANAHEREFKLHSAIFHHSSSLDFDESNIEVKLWTGAERDTWTKDFTYGEELLCGASVSTR